MPQFGHVHKPSVTRQSTRLSPMFRELQEAFEARRVEIQQNTAGIEPEQVLVIEIIGSVENFANAVKNINGFEWMGELESDEIAPDEDFYDEKHPGKELNGRLYLLMTNQQALNGMLSLWQRYQDDQNMQFERGLTKFRDVFLHLKSIRRWGVRDRLLETGVISNWREYLKYSGNKAIPFEVELWFRESHELRKVSESQVIKLVQQTGGRILGQSVIKEIAYHGILAELPANVIQTIVNNQNTELVKCDDVMFFKPVGQMAVGKEAPEGDVEITPIEEGSLPTGDPVIALFDGVPLTNHRLLSGRLIVDDPKKMEANYEASERVHGTTMASLIIHGDLNRLQKPLSKPVYVRPIMQPNRNDFDQPRKEHIPDDVLLVDLIHISVRRLFEGDGLEGPVAPSVRVINLSIGDPVRQFIQSMSPLARLLDWLSVKYGVLFIVSAGNHSSPISLEVSQTEFNSFNKDELESATIKALYRDARNRRLLSPAETINGISVGAVHQDESQITCLENRMDPFKCPLPSPVSAFGGGYRRAIKPDVIFNGGRQLYRLTLSSLRSATPVTIEPAVSRNNAPGNKVASLGCLPGGLNATSYSCGTSNATALISRAAGICYDSLQQIFAEQVADVDVRACEAPLLKAMLVHGCSWGDMGSRISDVLRTHANGRKLNELVSRWVGYGVPNVDRVLDCTKQRATVLGFGQLSDGEAHVFRLPLPPSLGSRPEWRRLTVTMAWLSPISARTQKYRTAGLWFEVDGLDVVVPEKDRRRESCSGSDGWRAVRRGTVQHEIFEGQNAAPFIDGNIICIKVNCREDAGKILNPVAYGLVVSLEVAEDVDIAVYDEIRTRIVPAIQIQSAITQNRG